MCLYWIWGRSSFGAWVVRCLLSFSRSSDICNVLGIFANFYAAKLVRGALHHPTLGLLLWGVPGNLYTLGRRAL